MRLNEGSAFLRRFAMAKAYLLSCRNVGVECNFETRADSVEKVVEQCADHARREHGMMSFSPDLFAKMRSCIEVLEEDASR